MLLVRIALFCVFSVCFAAESVVAPLTLVAVAEAFAPELSAPRRLVLLTAVPEESALASAVVDVADFVARFELLAIVASLTPDEAISSSICVSSTVVAVSMALLRSSSWPSEVCQVARWCR